MLRRFVNKQFITSQGVLLMYLFCVRQDDVRGYWVSACFEGKVSPNYVTSSFHVNSKRQALVGSWNYFLTYCQMSAASVSVHFLSTCWCFLFIRSKIIFFVKFIGKILILLYIIKSCSLITGHNFENFKFI